MKRIILFITLLIFYLFFFFWYGGNGESITVEEGKQLMEKIKNAQSDVEYSEIQDNFQNAIKMDDGKEFYMVNLETEKTGSEAKSADLSYAKLVIPMLFKRGSFPIYVGSYFKSFIGNYGTGITRVAIVRYRSLRDFLDMNADPDMVKGAPFKFASLNHTEVFGTKPILSLLSIRFTFALIYLSLYFFLNNLLLKK
ncbi:MAG: hypothetical protein KA146_14050 [Leptospiraceae bacterium]|nr:hypothetical protein [Leptospiraceae bacterium]